MAHQRVPLGAGAAWRSKGTPPDYGRRAVRRPAPNSSADTEANPSTVISADESSPVMMPAPVAGSSVVGFSSAPVPDSPPPGAVPDVSPSAQLPVSGSAKIKPESSLRTSADRCRLRAPAVSVGEELADDEDGGGEAEGGVSVPCSAVGVAAELAVVRPPRVGGLDDPSHAEP